MNSLGKNTGVDCHFLLQCVKVKSLSRVRLLATPWTAAFQAPPSMGFSRSGVPLPSPMKYLSILLMVSLEGNILRRELPYFGKNTIISYLGLEDKIVRSLASTRNKKQSLEFL